MPRPWLERVTGVRGPFSLPALYGLVAAGICVLAEVWPGLSLQRQVQALLIAGVWLALAFVRALAALGSRTPPPTAESDPHSPTTLVPELAALVAEGQKLAAIRLVRQTLGCSLVEAKQLVDAAASSSSDPSSDQGEHSS
ncbi:MAG: hypothetical protein K6U14_10945 [Firmicutes bacterium]|nr:hypothetical protein [Alicyclobacillaceae bacterium]MCL6498128.1 hypothetical protein [Bacillota bacterium]